MIRGQAVRLKTSLNSIWPKVYVPNGDFDNIVLLGSSADLSGKPASGLYLEPLELGWGDDPLLTGVDGDKSFIVVYPDALEVQPPGEEQAT